MDLASAFEKGGGRREPGHDQRWALAQPQRRQAIPAAGSFQRIDEDMSPPSTSPAAILSAAAMKCASSGEGVTLKRWGPSGVEPPPGRRGISLAQQVSPPLRHPERDVSAPRMTHQVDRPGLQPPDERDDVVDVRAIE